MTSSLQVIQDCINAELALIAQEVREQEVELQYEALLQEEADEYEAMYQAQREYNDSDGPWYWEH